MFIKESLCSFGAYVCHWRPAGPQRDQQLLFTRCLSMVPQKIAQYAKTELTWLRSLGHMITLRRRFFYPHFPEECFRFSDMWSQDKDTVLSRQHDEQSAKHRPNSQPAMETQEELIRQNSLLDQVKESKHRGWPWSNITSVGLKPGQQGLPPDPWKFWLREQTWKIPTYNA